MRQFSFYCAFGLILLALPARAAVKEQFLVAPTYVTGTLPGSIAVGDFNGDGVQDIAVYDEWRYGVKTGLSILLGNPDGTFQPAKTLSLNMDAVGFGSVVAADFNGDGKLDLAAGVGAGTYIYFGRGDGTFAPPVLASSVTYPRQIVVGDFNGDGKTDLALLGGQITALSVQLNNGDGTFAPPITYSVPGYAESLVAADFNADGKLDVAVASGDGGTNEITIFLGNGDGTLAIGNSYPAGFQPYFVLAADFNNDGILDLIDASVDGVDSLARKWRRYLSGGNQPEPRVLRLIRPWGLQS